MDVMGDVAWHQTMIANAKHSTGQWNVDVEKTGRYRFKLRRWPKELPIAMDAMISEESGNSLIYGPSKRNSLHPHRARLSIGEHTHCKEVEAESEAVVFELTLKKIGPTLLEAWFQEEGKDEYGAYYVDVERIGDEAGV